jgi:uracil permease
MNDNNLLYGISDKAKTIKEWVLYPFQMVLAVFVATVLIANLCHTDIAAALFGACIGTIIYQIITKFKSPMFISSCGATVSAVVGALCSTGAQWDYATQQWIGTPNYLMVIVGGLVILAIYGIFSIIVKKWGISSISKIFPPVIVGTITMVIGLNLSKFLISYCGQFGAIDASGTVLDMNIIKDPNVIAGVLVAIATMFITALTSIYGKGFLKNIPFLIGIIGGYVISVILFACGMKEMVDFSAFKNMQWYPDMPFFHPEYFV